MSDPVRAWQFYVRDMLDFTEQALTYTHGLDQATFLARRMVYDATLRNVELIGEAATHVPEAVRQAHHHIPWRLVIATRNRLIHGYLGIDSDTVWSIVQDDLPALAAQLRSLHATLTRTE